MNERPPVDWRKYIFAFVITCVIFFTAFSLANSFNNKRVAELRSIQDQIALNLLSSEVQSSLLQQFSCRQVGTTLLSEQLGSLGDKLAFAEGTRGADDPEVVSLKRNYSLLQIKDFLLMNNINEKCGVKNVFILYFYGKECDDCEKQGLVLTKLREDYPALRVYSFDYRIDVSAVQTLISINKIKDELPALLIDDRAYYGYKSVEEIEKLIPELQKLKKETATSTEETS